MEKALVRRKDTAFGRGTARFERGLMIYRVGIVGAAIGIVFLSYALVYRKSRTPTKPSLQAFTMVLVFLTAIGLVYYACVLF